MKGIWQKFSKFIMWILAVAILFAGVLWYLQHQRLYPSTDDAYVQGDIVQIAAQVNGPVSEVDVKDYQHVRKNEVLFKIDPMPFQIAVKQFSAQLRNTIQQIKAEKDSVNTARALLAERKAELTVNEKNAKRILTLVKKNLTAKAKGDEVTSQLEVAKAAYQAAYNQLQEAIAKLGDPDNNNAQIQQAKAGLEQAQLNLQHTIIYAPASGYLVNFSLRQGSMIPTGQPLFALVEDSTWWVSANFKETDLKRIKPGQSATIKLDIYPDHAFKGEVENISRGSGAAFALLPAENATGNWVKVTQRFPVRVKILNPSPRYPLRVGASSTVKVDTRSQLGKQ